MLVAQIAVALVGSLKVAGGWKLAPYMFESTVKLSAPVIICE